jgi:hypothetical protein
MDFESAIRIVKLGQKVTRLSWPSGQYAFRDPKNPAIPGDPNYLSLQTPQGTVQDGWVPSQEDKDAEDWHTLSQ